MTDNIYYVDQPHQLKEKIERTLARHPELAKSAINILVDQQTLTLEGQVNSYYSKQLAQESLKQILPLYRIRNEIHVAP